MEHNQNRGMMDQMELNTNQQIQEELSKINQSVLKSIHGVENGTLHFFTLPPDFIESSLLHPELLNNQVNLQNEQYHQLQSNVLDHNHGIQMYTTVDLQNLVDNNTGTVENDRRIASQPIQLVHKQQNHQIKNEAQVIVTNTKEMATITPVQEQEKQNISQNHTNLAGTNTYVYYHDQSLGSTHIQLQNQHHSLIQGQEAPVKLFHNTMPQQQSLPLPPLTPIRRITSPKRFTNIQNHFIKEEIVFEVRTDDEELEDSDAIPPLTTAKLPHKKRLSRKLNDQKKPAQSIKLPNQQRSTVISSEKKAAEINNFSCQLCGTHFADQLLFFTHLKSHYEPVPEQRNEEEKKKPSRIIVRPKERKVVRDENFTASSNLAQILNEENSGEFSETEDMLEGIRTVVQKVQETVDDDSNDDDGLTEKTWYADNDIGKSMDFDSHEIDPQEIHINAGNDNFVLFLNKNDLNEDDILGNHTNLQQNNAHHSQQNYSENDEAIPVLSFSAAEIESNQHIHEIDKLVNFNLTGNNEDEFLKNEKRTDELAMNSDAEDDDDNDADYQQSGEEEHEEEEYGQQSGEESVVITVHEIDNLRDVSKKEKIKQDDGDKKSKKYMCTEKDCDRTFNSKTAIRYHQLQHSGERPHVCDKCGKRFLTSSALKVHGRLHSGERPYKCEECFRMFRQWGDMKYHMASIHSTEKCHQCEFCGKEFARRYSLVVHRRIHTGEKNYICEFCDKTFRASSYLQNHRRIHTGEKPHQCPLCEKKFRCRGDMKRHINTHNRAKNDNKFTSFDVPAVTKKAQGEIIDLSSATTTKPKQDQLVFLHLHVVQKEEQITGC